MMKNLISQIKRQRSLFFHSIRFLSVLGILNHTFKKLKNALKVTSNVIPFLGFSNLKLAWRVRKETLCISLGI